MPVLKAMGRCSIYREIDGAVVLVRRRVGLRFSARVPVPESNSIGNLGLSLTESQSYRFRFPRTVAGIPSDIQAGDRLYDLVRPNGTPYPVQNFHLLTVVASGTSIIATAYPELDLPLMAIPPVPVPGYLFTVKSKGEVVSFLTSSGLMTVK